MAANSRFMCYYLFLTGHMEYAIISFTVSCENFLMAIS
jgi:hypothetical protein